MLVDAFDPVSPSRVIVVRGETQSLAAIVDGAGSWGSGREAADWARERLGERWRRGSSWSPHQLAEDISVAASSTPAVLRDPELGWSFSITCLLGTNKRGDLLGRRALPGRRTRPIRRHALVSSRDARRSARGKWHPHRGSRNGVPSPEHCRWSVRRRSGGRVTGHGTSHALARRTRRRHSPVALRLVHASPTDHRGCAWQLRCPWRLHEPGDGR